jgi:hypothetical protein
MTEYTTIPIEIQPADHNRPNAEAPESTPEPIAPVITIIEEELLKMVRPLSLVNGKGYAAAWIKVKIAVSEEKDKKGILIKYTPPKITMEKRLLVIREDGKTFGESGYLNNLSFEVSLGETPDPDKTWSGAGIERYKKGERPNPSEIFSRLIQLFDHFIDFYKSLADQRTMCELIACWVISTWFLDAFNVTGYLWLTGEKGSGKSDLLSLVAELSYLGQFISQSGSFASIRDMADYGATLCFDDAEGITFINDKDQDKRSLLLAGNHRGAKVTLKELGPDKKYHTKYINAFCPRAFSAIRVPDPILISRSIIIPLVRTSDKRRNNIDSADYGEWPCERRRLIDDLWAMGTCYLSQMPKFDKWVGLNAELSGRNLQPWRNVLAVAKWQEEMGVSGLYQRMHSLSMDYQQERPELELPDMTRLVIQALCNCAMSAIRANGAINKKSGHFETKVSDVNKAALSIIEEDELDIDREKFANRKVGKVMGKLRFDPVPRPGGKGSRLWRIDLQYLLQLADSYNVTLPDDLTDLDAGQPGSLRGNGTNGTNGSNGSEALHSNSSISEPSPITKPEKPCYSCGDKDYWQCSDGRWVCNTCHPNHLHARKGEPLCQQ